MHWDCFLIRRRLSRYLDGELSDRKAVRVERHLAGCAACQAELDAYHRTVRFVGGSRTEAPPAGSWDRLEARLEEDGVPGFGAHGPSPAGGTSSPTGLQPGSSWRAAVAAAAVILIAVLGVIRVPDLFAPPEVLAHDVDVASFLADLRQDRFHGKGDFGRTYRLHQVEANKAAESCPSGKNPPMELPAGYLLTRAMTFQTDCCPGLALEYRRGSSTVTVLQITGHHPMIWRDVHHEGRQIGMEHYEVHEETGLHTLVRNGGRINLLVAGDPAPEVLSEIASFLSTRAEAALEARGTASHR